MKLPKQAKPVMRQTLATPFKRGRGQTLIPPPPHKVVDLYHASHTRRFDLLTDLAHGANYYDPMRYLISGDSCGCHILSGSSMAMCLASCRLL